MSIKNGLLAITNEVLGDVQKEAEAIIKDAENQAKEALKAAKEQAEKNYQTAIDEAKANVDVETRKIASVTEVEMRNQLLQTKEDLVDAAFEMALSKLRDFTATKQYQDYLLKQIEALAKKLRQKSLSVQICAKDKTWLTQNTLDDLSRKINIELELAEQAGDFLGGCKVETVDGKMTYDGAIDNLLAELKQSLRVEVAKTLFGGT